jgi:hypothetical protein
MDIVSMQTNVRTPMERLNLDNILKGRIWTNKEEMETTGDKCKLHKVCLHQWILIWPKWVNFQRTWWCLTRWPSQTNKCLWILTFWTNRCGRTMLLLNHKMATNNSHRLFRDRANSWWINQWTICSMDKWGVCQHNKVLWCLNSILLSKWVMELNNWLKTQSKCNKLINHLKFLRK